MYIGDLYDILYTDRDFLCSPELPKKTPFQTSKCKYYDVYILFMVEFIAQWAVV